MSAIRPAASVILAAQQGDGDAYAVLLMKRSNKGSFSSAHVFPGGVQAQVDVRLAGGDAALALKVRRRAGRGKKPGGSHRAIAVCVCARVCA